MLRTALAGLLALASVWEGPVTLPSDDHINDTFQRYSCLFAVDANKTG